MNAMNTPDYTTEEFTATLPVSNCITRYRDAERIGGYCRSCPQYGRNWGCPPFDFDVTKYLEHYSTALIVATRIRPLKAGLPLSEARALIRPERQRLERHLLDMEQRYGGRSFAYAGSCLYCPEGTCTRPSGAACRHPEWVRPSLEACGFDLGPMVEELFGFGLQWGREGRLPEYLTLVCGFFHNLPANKVVWNG